MAVTMAPPLPMPTGTPKLPAAGSRFRAKRMVVTPEVATSWLEKNTTNRRVTQSKVEEYARDMASGVWHLTGDPLQFGVSGKLLNGQHRLWACILADTAFETMVIFGIENEDEVMAVIDTGKKRTLGDALKIAGEDNSNVLAAVISMCWRYEDTVPLTHKRYPTHEEGLAWLLDNPGVRQAIAPARELYRDAGVKLPIGALGAAYYLNSRVDAEAAEEFFRKATTGEELPAGSPILAYRRWAIGMAMKREKASSETALAYTLKAMNQWRGGKNVRLLVVKPDEDYPSTWTAGKR